ncbi:DNA-J related domain-containing protein [Motiliproteus sp. SC1-56]|uniref:DNA-J related domain-containing protein n=1 Tax=Motiliproteus sp. SC1-56 TaxID=2799565 RepID=UPI001A8E3B78|nr:DNA-J related domain-containing protein [Motiliproteus sp. SC1-56]
MPASTPLIENPLTALILPLILETPEGITEYELIQSLKDKGAPLPAATADPDLALFRTHFLVMNALYRLQQSLLEDGFQLQVCPLSIRLRPLPAVTVQALDADASQGALRDYYLDMEHWLETSGDEVRQLLRGFWQRFPQGQAQREVALQTLSLSTGASWREIQQAYRRLAARLHPDRGGDPVAFSRIRQAYEILKCQRA